MSSYQGGVLKDYMEKAIKKQQLEIEAFELQAEMDRLKKTLYSSGEINVVVKVGEDNYYVHINKGAEKISFTPVVIV